MPKGAETWPSRDLRHRFPLVTERQSSPRFDGVYEADDGAVSVRFRPDGMLIWGQETGAWKVDADDLLIATETRTGSGAIDLEAVFLLCTAVGAEPGREDRSQYELRFRFAD